MTTLQPPLDPLSSMSDDRLREYLAQPQIRETLGQQLACIQRESDALRVVKLALEVDLTWGARAIASLKPMFVRSSLGLILRLGVAQCVKNRLFGLTRSDGAIRYLMQQVRESDPTVSASAVRAIAQIGSEAAVEALQRLLEGADDSVQAWAAWGLGQIEHSAAVSQLQESLDHSNSRVREWAIWALGQRRSAAAFSALQQGLQHPDAEVRWRAVAGVGEWGKDGRCARESGEDGQQPWSEATENLVKMLADEEDFVREKAARALGKLKASAAVPALIRCLDDRDVYVTVRACEALGEIADDRALAGLAKALAHQEADIRSAAVRVVGDMGSDRAVDLALRGLQDRDRFVRARAAEALGKIGSQRAVRGLLQTLSDGESYVRWRGVSALGHIGSDRAVRALGEAIADSNLSVCQQAIHALRHIGSHLAVDALETAIAATESPEIRAMAQNALNQILNSASKTPLFQNSTESEKKHPQLPKLYITSFSQARDYLRDNLKTRSIRGVISIGSATVSPPPGFAAIPQGLRLKFDDIDTPYDDPDRHFARAEDICKILAFAEEIHPSKGALLVHCQAGISRSSAVAFVLCAALLGSGKERDALDYVLQSRPQAKPNRWIVELADETLSRDGKLIATLEAIAKRDVRF